jgi:sugar lactone lactonase YvrE
VENYPPITASLQVLAYSAQSGQTNLLWNVDHGPWQTNGAIISGLTAWEAYYGVHTVTVATSDGVELLSRDVAVYQNQANLLSVVIPVSHSFSIIAGYDGWVGSADGTNASARFAAPSGVTVDTQGNVFVADSGNSTIRRLTPMGTNWVVTTIAGQPGVVGSSDGTNNQTTFSSASGIAAGPGGQLYVADSGNCTIRELIPSGTNWIASTIAGQAGNCGTNDGTGGIARFNGPTGLAVGVDGSVYVADRNNCSIRKLTESGGVWTVTTIAGGTPGYNDGVGSQAQFLYPVALAVNAAGVLYVADYEGETIRELTPLGSDYSVKTIAGNPSSFDEVDGFGTASRFWGPQGITIDSSNNIYVVDAPSASAIRMLTPRGTNWLVSTISAGAYNLAYAFSTPRGIVADTNGNIFLASSGDDVIVKGWSVEKGNLKVTIAPAEAVTAGASWQVDGGSWRTNGETIVGLVTGTHVVTFSDVAGLSSPAPQTIMVEASQINTAEGDYGPVQGVLQVSLDPLDAVTNGARWQIDGGSWQTNGAIVSNLAYGHHVISFLTVSNWGTPPNQDVLVANNQPIQITGSYAPVWYFSVAIEPAGAVQSGAKWAIDDGPWQTNGATVTGTGWFIPHAVTFLAPDGWSAPSYQWVFLSAGDNRTITATYQQEGSLRVTLAPPEVVAAGAEWEPDDLPWQTNGATVVLTVGNHSIYFLPRDGWVTPTVAPVVVSPDKTNLTFTYTPVYGGISVNLLPKTAADAGARWQVDSGAWQNSGATVAVVPGSHVISFKPIANSMTPSNQVINVNYSATNLLSATYTLIESVPPTLTILTPSTNRPWAFPMLTVVGTAQDNVEVTTVYYRFNNGAWLLANGTTNWAATVNLSPGTNIVSAFAVDVNGVRSKTNSITANYFQSSRLTIDIAGSGTVSPNLSGDLLYLGQSYTVTATPAKGSVFSNWTGDVNYDLPRLTFVMRSNMFLQANFVPSPFKPFAGKYTGLSSETNDGSGISSGQFSASVTSNGTFTAKLNASTLKLSFAGQFSALGYWTNSAPQSHGPPITESLQIDMNGSGTMTGQFGKGISNEYVLARESSFAAGNPAPQAGKYTLFFFDNSHPTEDARFSYAFGTLSVDESGIVHFKGKLGDGTRITQGGAISDSGEWPFYASPNGSTDSLSGWILFTNSPNTSLTGHIYRIKLAGSNDPTELLAPLDVFGSRIRSSDKTPPEVQR